MRALLLVSLALHVAIARAEAAVGSSTLSTETAASDAPAGAATTTSDEPVAPKPKKTMPVSQP